MKNHPTPQPSGRTAREIIAATVQEIGLLNNSHGTANLSHARFHTLVREELEACERQLFDALLEIVAQTPFYELKDGWAVDKDRLEAKLRVFFNQSKDGDE